jgi:FkbM family methyltransferase
VEFPLKLGLCERIYGRSLARKGICWAPTAPGPVWKLDLANPTHRWIVYGSYEGISFWRWVRAQSPGIRTIVDSGANIGQTVIYFASMLPEARILAYEPGAAARRWLEEGIEANRFDRVEVVSSGLGSAPGRAFLANSGNAELHGSWNQVNATEGDVISIVTLDEELERRKVAAVDLWKLDVEGYEIEALRGAAGALAAGRIRALYMEMGKSSAESMEYLRGFGYAGWNLRDSGRAGPWREEGGWENVLFLPPGRTS